MSKYVIYSVIAGTYDNIQQPMYVDNRFDYVLFSDTISSKQLGVWQVRPIPDESKDNMRKSRYAKCHPTKVLSEYESSLYLDANIQIAKSEIYQRYLDLSESSVEWAGIKHPNQQCIYEEICAILSLQWIHDYDVVDWYAKLKKVGFPEDYGLYENSVIFRRHTKKVEEVGDIWWQTLENGIKRDQFSLMYSLWRVQPEMAYLLSEDECPRTNSTNFNYYPHNPHKRVVDLGLNEKIRNRCMRIAAPDVRIGYHKLFDNLSKFSHPLHMLYLWEIYAVLAFGPKLLVKYLRFWIRNK